MYIESPQNARVREWSKLKTKRGRLQTGLFLVEGARLTEELLASKLEVETVLWDVGTDELPETLQETIRSRKIPFCELSPSAFAAISDTVTPQGVMAVAKVPAESADTRAPFAVLLDGVQDPGNVGTLIRTADAFGVGELCCGTGTADAFAPKVVRATMGGLFRLPVLCTDSVAYIERWRSAHPGGDVVLTSADATETCMEHDFCKPTLLIIGSEAFGVSEDTKESTTSAVKIPMAGQTESLNAAIAGSILLYEAFRQRQK